MKDKQARLLFFALFNIMFCSDWDKKKTWQNKPSLISVADNRAADLAPT